MFVIYYSNSSLVNIKCTIEYIYNSWFGKKYIPFLYDQNWTKDLILPSILSWKKSNFLQHLVNTSTSLIIKNDTQIAKIQKVKLLFRKITIIYVLSYIIKLHSSLLILPYSARHIQQNIHRTISNTVLLATKVNTFPKNTFEIKSTTKDSRLTTLTSVSSFPINMRSPRVKSRAISTFRIIHNSTALFFPLTHWPGITGDFLC